MTTLREAAQQALEALEEYQYHGAPFLACDGAVAALRAALAQEQAEPVAVVGTQVDVWRGCDGRWAPPGEPIKTALMLTDMPVGTMLYAAPPQRQPLTEEEIVDAVREADLDWQAGWTLDERAPNRFVTLARAAIAKATGEQP